MDEQLYMIGSGLDLNSKIEKAILNLQCYEKEALKCNPVDGYYLAFSGGKDSIVIKDLAKRAGVKFKAFYNLTTIDPPELIRFIKQHHADVAWNRQKQNFFHRLVDKGMPTRLGRWCCSEYKEQGGKGNVIIIGVRAAESARRSQNWKMWTPHRKEGWILCPILYWTDEDVWHYIKNNNLPYPSLYDEGFKRLGCIGCPMAGDKRYAEFERWPLYEKAWRRACNKLWSKNHGRLSSKGKPYSTDAFSSGEHLFKWWMEECPAPNEDDCQMGLF